ncbi:MAG: hypothetical protein EA420_14945 [Candidatus Competibacteraceae bacterium]|nr:MAG: hypothetical protein EA420_14945 [Candidatus Competibacteraceae bacterium]
MLLGGGFGHFLAGVAVMVSSLPWWVQAVFLVGIVLSLIEFGYCYGYRHGPGFIACIELLDGRWRLETGTGVVCRGQLTGGYAHPLLMILNFRLEDGGRRSVTLLPDAADPETLRRLRVWLRTRRDAEDESEPP